MSTSSSNNDNNNDNKEDSIVFRLTDPAINTNEVRQQLNSPHAAIAFLLHLFMVQRGFRCVGLSENDPITELPSDANPYLPLDGWNRSADVFTFKYKHSQSAMTFLLKCVTLGDRLLVHALAIEDKKPYGLELDVTEYIDASRLGSSSDLSDLYNQLDKIETLFKLAISNQLVPFLNKDGYEANRTASATSFPYGSSSSNISTSSSSSSNDNNREARPERSRIPDDDDPLRIGPPRMPRSRLQEDPYGIPRNPYNVGGEDLYPDLGVPHFGGGPRLPFHGGGSMVGPNHPAFSSGGGVFMPPRHGPPGNLPQGVPPRARFDPYGPPGTGVGRNPNPNPDELRPPRFRNDDNDSNPFFF
jgi:hypothetical protein